MNYFDSADLARFARRIEEQHRRLDQLYSKTYHLHQQGCGRQDPLALPLTPSRDGLAEVSLATFKELGVASEELQVILEELYQQNQELIAARQAVETERQRYHHLFEFAPDSYLVTDTAGKIQEANRAAATLLNVSKDFLIGKPLAIFIPVVERQHFRSILAWLHEQVGYGAELLQQEQVVQLQPRHGEPFPAVLSVVLVCEARLDDHTCDSVRLPYSSLKIHGSQAPSTLGTVLGRPTENSVTSFTEISQSCSLRWLLRRTTAANHLAQPKPGTELPARGSSPVDTFLGERQLQSYHAGEVIPLNPQSVWFISQGLVKLSTFSQDGEEVLVGLAVPSTSFGPGLTSLQTYQAVALSEVQLVSSSLAEIANCPTLAQKLLPQINQRLQQTESLLAIAGVRKVSNRLYQLLLLLKQEIGQPAAQGTRLSVRLTHQDFANACSTTRATITRQLLNLQQQGKISWCPKRHLILNSDF